MCRLYLAFKPVSSPFSQTIFRAENIKPVHTASFSHNWFASYDFSADLASHDLLTDEEMVLSGIKLFLEAGGIING